MTSAAWRRAYGHVVGWLAMLLGLAIIGAVVLTPAWVSLERSRWEKGLIEEYQRRQQTEVLAYEQFSAALSSNDPVVLQRVAFHQLRLKPKGATLAAAAPEPDVTFAVARFGPAAANGPPADHWASDTLYTRQSYELALVDQWLHEPKPAAGRDYPAWRPPRGAVVRLTTGPMRLPLLAVAGIFMMASFLVPATDDEHTAVAQGAETNHAAEHIEAVSAAPADDVDEGDFKVAAFSEFDEDDDEEAFDVQRRLWQELDDEPMVESFDLDDDEEAEVIGELDHEQAA